MKLIFGLCLATVLFLSSCASTTSTIVDTVSSATLQRYRTNEIKEYQGERLDPAIGPRDNSINGIQHVDISNYTLTLDGLVDSPQTLTYDEVLALTAVQRLVTLHCVEGWQATILWQGVQLSELFALTTVDPTANTVIFHCVDGYTTSLPLATVVENNLILAYQANELPLPDEMGFPFIVVAEDKYGYKWARWVTRIELSADANYKGYWETIGYDNDADLP